MAGKSTQNHRELECRLVGLERVELEQVKTNILAHTMPGSIILQHAAGGVGEDLSERFKHCRTSSEAFEMTVCN